MSVRERTCVLLLRTRSYQAQIGIGPGFSDRTNLRGNFAATVLNVVEKPALLRPCGGMPLAFSILLSAEGGHSFTNPLKTTYEMIAYDILEHLCGFRLASNRR